MRTPSSGARSCSAGDQASFVLRAACQTNAVAGGFTVATAAARIVGLLNSKLDLKSLTSTPDYASPVPAWLSSYRAVSRSQPGVAGFPWPAQGQLTRAVETLAAMGVAV